MCLLQQRLSWDVNTKKVTADSTNNENGFSLIAMANDWNADRKFNLWSVIQHLWILFLSFSTSESNNIYSSLPNKRSAIFINFCRNLMRYFYFTSATFIYFQKFWMHNFYYIALHLLKTLKLRWKLVMSALWWTILMVFHGYSVYWTRISLLNPFPIPQIIPNVALLLLIFCKISCATFIILRYIC